MSEHSTNQETTKQRHERWCKLQHCLCSAGVNNVPRELLRDPEPDTRPDVWLVAYYSKIKHQSLGKLTASNWLTIVLSVIASFWTISGIGNMMILDQQQWWFLLVPLIVGLAAWRVLKMVETYEGPLSLSVEELSLSLPDRNRHTRWCDVFAVSHVQEKSLWTFWNNRSRVRVELNDGVVARLHVPEDDCDPLVELMQDLIIHHRKKSEDCGKGQGDCI